MSYLLLKPENKLAKSCDFLKAQGLDVVGLPLIKIEPDQANISKLPGVVSHLPDDSLLIFTSTQAVDLSAEYLRDLSSSNVVFAVGTATAAKLTELGIEAIVPEQHNSEGLVGVLPAECQNKAIYIFKGHGGRTFLQENLRAKGANVLEINLYHRVKNQEPKPIGEWNAEHIDCIIATSGELVEAAFAYLEKEWLIAQKWILVSERLRQVAEGFGITKILISNGTSDKAIAACIHASAE